MDEIHYDFDPRQIPLEYLAAIGLVSAASAQTEAMVEMLIASCLGVDGEFAQAVTVHMSAPQRDNLARAVAELAIDNVNRLDELDLILDDVNTAAEKRNAIVHNTWCRNPANGDVFTMKQSARRTVRVDFLPITLDQIKADAQFVYDAGMAVARFMVAMKLVPKPTPDRPRGHKTPAARKARRKQQSQVAGFTLHQDGDQSAKKTK